MRRRRLRAAVASMCFVVGAGLGSTPAAGETEPLLDVNRVAGADRYATAAALSADLAAGVPAVFIATGENFPDALAAGPAANLAGSPVLLTRPTALPDATTAALDRLDPINIIVLGGPGAVSDAVLAQLGAYVNGGSVVRVAGTDRFETAAAVAARFPAPTGVAYVANGRGFADALAAGPAAGVFDGPMLLVEPDRIPAATAAQLDRLDPEFIVIAGDFGVVSADVQAQLGAYAPNVVRQAGPDRYATSAVVSRLTFTPPVPRVYLATGANFPDAIAASAFAAPILLSERDCIPAVVIAELVRLDPDEIVVLGGTDTLGPGVEQLQGCPAPPANPAPGLPRTG